MHKCNCKNKVVLQNIWVKYKVIHEPGFVRFFSGSPAVTFSAPVPPAGPGTPAGHPDHSDLAHISQPSHSPSPAHLRRVRHSAADTAPRVLTPWHAGKRGQDEQYREHLHIKSFLPGLPQHKQKHISDSTHPGEQLLDALVMWLRATPLPCRVIEHLHCFSELLHSVPNGFHQGLIMSAHRQAQKRRSRVKLAAQRLEEHSTITNKPGKE